MFEFKDKPREELNEGHASFKVMSWAEHYNKESALSLKLSLRVTDNRNKSQSINDFFNLDNTRKIKGLLASAGFPEMMQGGKVDPNKLISMSGECIIKKKIGTDFMNIAEYLPNQRDPNDQQSRSAGDEFLDGGDAFDSEIPF